jgi:hypothetical protein
MDADFHETIRVANFWRKVIGDYEYVNYDPDDLDRWYHALETRGPLDIRAYLNERYGKHPMPRLLGLVSKPPHPPMDVVMKWLEFHELKSHTAPLWLGSLGFFVICLMFFSGLEGCQNLKDLNLVDHNPGPTTPQIMPPPAFAAPVSQSFVAPTPPPPASQATGGLTLDNAPTGGSPGQH